MLRKIILEDFMSHRHTELDLAEGLTVLTGPNNCGKSAVVAALQILSTNGRTTHVMRHGAKLCRITVETDDGHTVIWERKNNTVKYTLNGEDIHRVGSTTPDSLHDLLRLDRVEADTGKTKQEYDIHFGEQKSPIFLLGETGSRAASFFASSSDASRLVEMQHRHRSNLRERKSEVKRLTTERQNNEKRLEKFEPLDRIAESVDHAESLQKEVESTEKRIQNLRRLSLMLRQLAKATEHLGREQTALARIDSTPITPAILLQESARQDRLALKVQNLSALVKQRSSLRDQVAVFDRLTPVPPQSDVTSIRARIIGLKNLKSRSRACRRILDCSEALIIPPQMLPARQCKIALQALRDATDRLHEAEQAGTVLSRLQMPPQTHDCKGLKSLLTHLTELTRRRARAIKLVDRMMPLYQPPTVDSTQRLESLASELRNRTQMVRKAQIAVDALRKLRSVDDPVAIDSVVHRVHQLRTATSAVLSAQAAAKAAQQAVEQSELQLRAFIAENPTCQTCGGSIDPETLLSSAPSIHHHTVHGAADE